MAATAGDRWLMLLATAVLEETGTLTVVVVVIVVVVVVVVVAVVGSDIARSKRDRLE